MNPRKNPLPAVAHLALPLFLASQAIAQNVTIDLNKTHQTIRGFGGMTHRVWTGYDLNASDRNLAFGNGPGQIGMTILRMWVSDQESQWSLEVPTAKDVVSRGGIVFATPWSPPSSMRVPGGNNFKLNPANYGSFATHLNKFAKYMKDNGAPLHAISFANEPDWCYDWTCWTPDEVYNFTKNNAASLREQGTKVISAESFRYDKNYYNQILNDANVLKNIDIIGAHFYASDAKTANSFFQYPLADGKGKERWMTEHYTESKGDANMWKGWINTGDQDQTPKMDSVRALDVAYEIHRALVEGQFNAYVWWYIRRDYGPIKNSDGKVSKRGYCMANYAKFVRPGFVRVEATKNPSTHVYLSAYKKGDSVVVVVVNRSATANLNISIPAATGLTKMQKYTTSATKNVNDDGSVPVVNGSLSVTFDAEAVTTLVGTSPIAPPEPKGPFSGTAAAIPGRIEAEDYDKGGEGKGYHEGDAQGNQFDATYRNDDVDIEATKDSTGAFDIGYTLAGEWLEYTVDVKADGKYSLDLRLAEVADNRTLHLELDGKDITGPVVAPNTGDWQSWTTKTVEPISLTKGEHLLRLVFDSSYINVNYLEFRPFVPTSVLKQRTAGASPIRSNIASGAIELDTEGAFTFRISTPDGTLLESGAGTGPTSVGSRLAPGLYVVRVRSESGSFEGTVLKN
ncbi:MAG: carbohydrate-binding protein [Fibrobacteria bacterium]|nr:carbohydrate-binding protein [Fibrobacteria bacterium]